MPDGQRVVTGSVDTTLRLWRASDGGLIAELTGHKDKVYRGLAVRQSDGMIASGDFAGEIRLWDSRTGQFLRTFANQGVDVGILRYSPDGKWLLSSFGFCEVCKRLQRVWDVATGKELVTFTEHDNSVFAGAISPDGRFAATAGFNGDIRVWELATGRSVKEP